MVFLMLWCDVLVFVDEDFVCSCLGGLRVVILWEEEWFGNKVEEK